MQNITELLDVAMLSQCDADREKLEVHVKRLEPGLSVLDGIDTDGVLPLVTPLAVRNVLREDVAVKNYSKEELLKNAPDSFDGYFRAPGTIG